jgi:outer membrane protein insertion porin family
VKRLQAALLLAALTGICLGAQSAPQDDPLPGGGGAPAGQMVVRVSLIADGPIDPAEIAGLVAVRAGKPLTEEDAAATVRNLFATRRFADVRIEAESQEGGLAVTVVLFRAFRVRPLRLSGRASVSDSELRRSLPFAAGSVYTSELVAQGADALERRLQAEGYLTARVQSEVVFDRQRFDARVTYRMEAGKAARVAEAFFDGDTAPFAPSEVALQMRLKPGDRYRESLARADAVRMTDFLHKKEHDRAMVELIAAQPDDSGRITPVYRVRIGPRVAFEGEGITPQKLAKELHAMAETQPLDEELVLQYVEARRDALQRSGHYRAVVTYAFDAKSDPAVTHIRVGIVEGPKFFVEAVRFKGNAALSDKTLYGLMTTRKKGLPLVTSGRLVDSVLADDAEAILGTYQSRGWIRAKVAVPRVEDGSKKGGLVVTVSVEEGPRAMVVSRLLEGAEHLDLKAAEKLLTVKEGAPLNPNAARQDAGALTAWYHDRGWREAAVRDVATLSDDGTSARVVYRVDEGLKSFFGKVIIRGNTRTSTARMQRLATWKEGDALSESRLLETQSRLSRAGVFRRVEVRPERADPASQSRNVDVDVEEGRPWSLLYGVGYQYNPQTTDNQNDPYLAGGVSYNNILGRMIAAGIEAQYAPFSRRGRVQVSIREPYLFGSSYPLNLLAFFSKEVIQNVPLERRGVTLDSSRIVAPGLRIGLRTTYQRIQLTSPETLALIDFVNLPAINRPINEFAIGPDVLFDRRDDIIDPHAGYYLAGAYKLAFARPDNVPADAPFQPEKTRFSRFSTQATGYIDLGRRWTLAGSARVGGAFGVTPGTSPIPIAERFFAGGRSTDRAWDTDVLGIPGTAPLDQNQTVDYSTIATPHTGSGKGTCAAIYPDLPTLDCDVGPRIVGGKGFFALNLELRIPIAGNLGGVLFWDAAQVWRDFSQIRFQFESNLGLRQGVGFGLRYMTPIGPVRVEYGWPVRARTIPFNVVQQNFDASGKPIPCAPDRAAESCFTILKTDSVKEPGRFFFSIGYPF